MHPQTPTPAPTPASTPTPLTSRQERFCQAFVIYATAATAALEAGYTPRNARQHGYRLLKTDRIRARVREIQSSLAADHGRDLDVLLGKLEIVYRRAIEDHHFTAAGRAVEMQARLGRMAKIPALSLSLSGPRPPSSARRSGLREGGSPPVDLSLSGVKGARCRQKPA